jgi:hypothetical protein
VGAEKAAGPSTAINCLPAASSSRQAVYRDGNMRDGWMLLGRADAFDFARRGGGGLLTGVAKKSAVIDRGGVGGAAADLLVVEKGEPKKASFLGPMAGGGGMSEKAEARDEDELKPPREETERTEAEESDGGDPGRGERRGGAAMTKRLRASSDTPSSHGHHRSRHLLEHSNIHHPEPLHRSSPLSPHTQQLAL